jgi:putative transposase
MAAFFRRVPADEKSGYPRFTGAGWFDTVTWPKDGDGCLWNSQPDHPTQTRVRLQGIGHITVNQHRPVQGTVKTLSVTREGARWYLVFSCDDVPAVPRSTFASRLTGTPLVDRYRRERLRLCPPIPM